MNISAINLSTLEKYILDHYFSADPHAILTLDIKEVFGNQYSYQLCHSSNYYLRYFKWDRISDSNNHMSQLLKKDFDPVSIQPLLVQTVNNDSSIEEIILQANNITIAAPIVVDDFVLDGDSYCLKLGKIFFPTVTIAWRGDLPNVFSEWRSTIDSIISLVHSAE